MTDQISTFPASFAQRRLWFIQQCMPASAAYNMLVATTLPDSVDPKLVQAAFDALVARHESLRTSFEVESGEVVQRISCAARVQLQVHRLDTRSALGSVLSLSTSKPFDLSSAPLARVHLAIYPELLPTLALVVHHIIADGQTLRILLEDLASALQALREGRTVVLEESPIEYADYAVWQRRSLAGRRLEKLANYWTRRLEVLPELKLPQDRERPRVASVQGGMLPLRIDANTAARLRALAAASRTTTFAVLLSGLAALLSRFSGQRDFGIGIPVSGRDRIELERVTGLFVNSMVFRATVDPEKPFAELLHHTAKAMTDDLSHQEMPFELVVDALRVKRRADRNPLFQVMLQVQTQPRSAAVVGPAGAADEPQIDSDKLSSQLDLSFILFDRGEGVIDGAAVFSTALFDRASISQLVDSFNVLLAGAAQETSRPVGLLPLVNSRRREALLALGERPKRAWPGPHLLHEWFAQQARCNPDAIAIESAEKLLSFADLNRRANGVAAVLRRVGARQSTVVAICLPRSVASIIALIGVLKTGAAYLMLDPATPPAHREFVLNDCGACAVIAPSGRCDWAFGREFIDLEKIFPCDDNCAAEPPTPRSAAYVIYTSGSTGRPKGIAIPHEAIVNHMRWMIDRFDWRVDDRVLQRTPLSFDASIWEVWGPLLAGATLVLAPADGPFDPGRLLAQVQHDRITMLQVVPSLLRALIDRPEATHCTSLRRVFCGGEALSMELSQRALRTFKAELVNLYGPSETTIDATCHVCASGSTEPEVPIGRPIANVVARVLDSQMEPVPCGVVGELYIGGAAVGLGYIGSDPPSPERFLADPHASGARLFRTGDLACVDHDGILRFRGRIDDQVKLRGFRIELGGVDAQLLQHPAVAEAATVVQQPAGGEQRLMAFVRLHHTHSTLSAHELLEWLRMRLPAHAVPSGVSFTDMLPTTPHGKIDRLALKDRPIPRETQGIAWSAPRSAAEREICHCFCEALAVERVGIDDDFFLLGGHSLLVLPVCEALARVLGIEVNVVDLFEFPSPRLLAQTLSRRKTQPPFARESIAMNEG